MDIAVLGVDLGKNVCSVVGLDTSGAVVMRRKVRHDTLIALAEKLPPCVVGMEACCGAHHLGRLFAVIPSMTCCGPFQSGRFSRFVATSHANVRLLRNHRLAMRGLNGGDIIMLVASLSRVQRA